jgi:hypothetical protein
MYAGDGGAGRAETVVAALLPARRIARTMAGKGTEEEIMNRQSRKHCIARTVAAAALTLASQAGVAATVLTVASGPAHATAQLIPPTRVLPPDPCRAAC